MAKLGVETISTLIYDGTTPPEDFIRLFNIQSIFMDWKDADQLKNIPFFLVGRAQTCYDDATTKPNSIKEAKAVLVAGCGPSAEKYMSMFFSKKRKNNESMMAHGLKMQEFLQEFQLSIILVLFLVGFHQKIANIFP
jgi:hypothetical protein